MTPADDGRASAGVAGSERVVAVRGPVLWPAVLVGGMVGSGARWVAVATASWAGVVVVDAVNVVGAFLLGAMAARLVDARSRAFWLTGVLGSLTTWSTFMVDAVVLAQRGAVAWALAHVLLTCGVGLVAARAGQRLAGPEVRP